MSIASDLAVELQKMLDARRIAAERDLPVFYAEVLKIAREHAAQARWIVVATLAINRVVHDDEYIADQIEEMLIRDGFPRPDIDVDEDESETDSTNLRHWNFCFSIPVEAAVKEAAGHREP